MARAWRCWVATRAAARLGCAAGLVLALSCAAARAADAQAAAVQASASAPEHMTGGFWAHQVVNRPAEPAVRFGKLPNGMRYAPRRTE